jgi:hypothetical protein
MIYQLAGARCQVSGVRWQVTGAMWQVVGADITFYVYVDFI